MNRPSSWAWSAAAKSRTNLKNRLLEAGILQNRCEECGLTEWRGKRLSIQIDHVNGVRDDNRLENLRMLCPNCHSQTETFASRNRGKYSLFPGRLMVGRGPLEAVIGVRVSAREPRPHRLAGLGRWSLKPPTGVRIPLSTPHYLVSECMLVMVQHPLLEEVRDSKAADGRGKSGFNHCNKPR